MSVDFTQFKKVHFIGIGGIGVSAIARMMMLEGKQVSGSDRAESPVTEELARLGALIHYEQKAENIAEGTGLVIYTIAIPDDNPELARARELGITCLTYPQALGAISETKYTIAVSGTHGKTTTTAMIGKVLIDAGLDPTVVVGSLMRNADGEGQREQAHELSEAKRSAPVLARPATEDEERVGEGGTRSVLKDQNSRVHTSADPSTQTLGWTNFVAGKSKYLVAEACEYRRSFLNLSPKILVITNIDNDHLDYYKNMQDIQSAFIEMVKKIPEDGYLVCNKELPFIAAVADEAQCTIVDYELFGNQNLALKVPGEHNLMNAAAVLAVADILGISRKVAEHSLSEFAGTWRRFECKGKVKNGALIYDDYGHHPTEVKATLRGARSVFPNKRIIVVFQPHLFSRTREHLKEFGKAFNDVDFVIVAPIYPAREPFDPAITSDMVAREIVKNGGVAIALPSLEAIEMHLRKELSSERDVLITMGAGDVYTVAEKLVTA